VFLVPGASFEELLAVPEIAALARSGGAALMSLQGGLPTRVQRGVVPGEGSVAYRWLLPSDLGGLTGVGAEIRREVMASPADPVLVFVASPVSSAEMVDTKDDIHPLVMAEGTPARLFDETGGLRSLTSDSTRRIGVVSDLDVVPTIADFRGVAAPVDSEGSVLRVIDEPLPVGLHERYLAQRRMHVPIGIAAGLYVTLVGLFGVLLLVSGPRPVPERLAHMAGWMAMSVPALGVGLLAAGHLPTLSYRTVVPFVIAVTLVGTLAFVPLRRFGTLVPPAAIGVAVLAFFAVEAALGWKAALTPFLGGSELDGGRFYGLPNVFIGLLVGASLYVAQRLRTAAGFIVAFATGLFAGLPGMGANLGGAVTLFAAAGLWMAERRFGRIGWKGLAITALSIVAGALAVLLAHRLLTEAPTHVTRFEETVGGIADVWRTFIDRLLVGWRLLERNPFALVPVLGLPVVLWAIVRPPRPLRIPLERHRRWRDALLVTILAGIVAYVANDSGAAAAGLAFGLGLGGLLYVSLIEGTWKMGAT
jgi:hypothetical protein